MAGIPAIIDLPKPDEESVAFTSVSVKAERFRD